MYVLSKSTPARQTSGSLLSRSQTRDEVDTVFKQELQGILHGNLSGFISTVFNDQLPFGHQKDPTSILKTCEEMGLWKNESWQGFTEKPILEKQLYDPFVRLANNILSIEDSTSAIQWVEHGDTPLQGSKAKRKADMLLVPTDKAQNRGRQAIFWRDVLVVMEIKRDSSDGDDTTLQLASYAREVFGAQDNRRFVFGITLSGFVMRVWLFDRAGGIGSEAFEINENPDMLVRVIVGFAAMYRNNRTALGYDPTIFYREDDKTRRINIGGEEFILDATFTLPRSPAVASRATICWKAYKAGNPKKFYAIKDSWRLSTRDEEGPMLRDATDKLRLVWDKVSMPSLVAQYHTHENVCVAGRQDNTNNNRNNLVQQCAQGEPPQPYRIHTRIVVSMFGERIEKFRNALQLLVVLRDAIEGHWQLFDVAKILHRDISLNNIMINPDVSFFLQSFLASHFRA